MVTIKILGTGCPNCKKLEREVNEALANGSIQYELVKVTDYADIMAYGVMSTPGLVINETLLTAGRVPSRQQIINWAEQHQGS